VKVAILVLGRRQRSTITRMRPLIIKASPPPPPPPPHLFLRPHPHCTSSSTASAQPHTVRDSSPLEPAVPRGGPGPPFDSPSSSSSCAHPFLACFLACSYLSSSSSSSIYTYRPFYLPLLSSLHLIS